MAKRNIGKEIVQGLEEIKAWKKGETKLKTDAVIRHVTKPGANLFRELGFSPVEAKQLHAESTVRNARSEKARDRWKDGVHREMISAAFPKRRATTKKGIG